MDLIKVRDEIRKLIEEKRKKIELKFIEEDHVYFMKDNNGIIKSDFPSVSKVIKHFYEPFDAHGISLNMSNGDVVKQKKLLKEWEDTAKYSTNLGSRVHYELESYIVEKNNNYKEVRIPIFECDPHQIKKSDKMILAGKEYISLMEQRNAVLLDTEIVLGDNELGYTGQPDKVWLINNKNNDDFGFIITDWKTNQTKSFEVQRYTKKMFWPFQDYHSTALGHYYLQLPLYGKLLIKMLEGTKFENKNLLGCIVILLKEDGTYQEYRVPSDVIKKVFNLNFKILLK
jgi:hypothetical protein